MHLRSLLILVAILGNTPALAGGDYAQSRANMVDAYRSGDFARMVVFADQALQARC